MAETWSGEIFEKHQKAPTNQDIKTYRDTPQLPKNQNKSRKIKQASIVAVWHERLILWKTSAHFRCKPSDGHFQTAEPRRSGAGGSLLPEPPWDEQRRQKTNKPLVFQTMILWWTGATRVYQKQNRLSAKAHVSGVRLCLVCSIVHMYHQITQRLLHATCNATTLKWTRNHALAAMFVEIPAQFASQEMESWTRVWKLLNMLNPPQFLGWAHKFLSCFGYQNGFQMHLI